MPITLPDLAWQHSDVRRALHDRQMGAVLRFVQHHTGASQGRLSMAVGMTQSRVNEIMNGRRVVSRLDVFERIADGLSMPDAARQILGLAARRRVSSTAFELAAWPEIVRVYESQDAAAAEIQRTARSASEIDVLAVRGLGLLGLSNSLLRPHLDRDGDTPPRLRVLLLDPDSPAAAQRAAEIGESTESLAAGIRAAEARLRELVPAGGVEVYRYRALPVWRVIRLGSVLYVGAFDAEWEGHESATYKLVRTPNGPLWAGFRRLFDAMVEDSTRII
ncbi:helix-turn-helix domain-containing protein [Kitasatospora sp. NPDC004615]|uniref:helix-turn-helix domain-containing protein n=1 Tax=unclassified Kitasatospora TaxID=2633591 RepID=UPI00368D9BA9